jgi:hypothetical protein
VGLLGDGDDYTGPISNSVRKSHTWCTRFYTPPSDTFDTEKLIGDRENRWSFFILPIYSDIKIEWFDVDGNKYQAQVKHNNVNYDDWNTVAFTIDEESRKARINVNGKATAETTADADFQSYSGDSHRLFRNTRSSGFIMSHIECHPVLTEAEAETVRKRLATAPEDPVPPTERWDLGAESSPHNFVEHSEDFTQWYGDATVTADTDTAPDGSTAADTVEDTDDTDYRTIRSSNIMAVSGARYTALVRVKKQPGPIFEMQQRYSSKGAANIQLNPDTGNIHENRSGDVNHIRGGAIDVGQYWLLYAVIKQVNRNTGSLKIIPAISTTLGTAEKSVTGSQVVWGAQVVRGDIENPPYVKTGSSIAFPQTVPAQRDNANDLTLGSTSGADTSDPDWVAPKGLSDDGDDQQRIPPYRPIATWVGALQTTNARVWGRAANGWTVTDTALVAEDEQGNTVSAAHGLTLTGGGRHQIAVLIDTTQQTARLYADATLAPAATLDLSQIGTLKSGDVELLPQGGGTLYDAEVYTRALTDEEALHARQRILNNPDSRIPLLN